MERNRNSSFAQYRQRGAEYYWKTTNRRYQNFTDLGNYVIDCDRHRNFDFDRARAYCDQYFDIRKRIGCTAFGTRAENGDVLIGRNLDLTVSQFPCYITHVKWGKYDTLNFTYDEIGDNRTKYGELLEAGAIDEDYYNALPMVASDSMNSAGLYIEYNMREYEKQFICLGTNPECDTRICTVSLPFVVTSNCATVKEALKFMRESLNLYTMVDRSIASGWNLCCMMGDATGEYGLLEIANDEIRFLPRQHGQGNYYIYPEYNCISRDQSGYGRLQFGLERIDQIQNDAQMMDLMKQAMWKNEILCIPYAYRDQYGHIHFCADPEHKIPSLDWRSDNVRKIPVNANGKYVDISKNTPEALLVREYKRCYDLYRAGDYSEKNQMGFERYQEYLNRSDLTWVQTNENFEDLQYGLMQYYEQNGTIEKLRRYYAGDEKPLRDDGEIMTTSLSFSVNCTQKRLTVRFWEKPHTVMKYQW